MSRGPYLGVFAWSWRWGCWRVEVNIWPQPRFWEISLMSYRELGRGFNLCLGPLELEVVR